MRTILFCFCLAFALSACGAPDTTSATLADDAASSPALEGTWVNVCGDTTITITITATHIDAYTHVDGQSDWGYSGAPIVRAGHLIIDQGGAEIDLGSFLLVEQDQLLLAGANGGELLAGVYRRAPAP